MSSLKSQVRAVRHRSVAARQQAARAQKMSARTQTSAGLLNRKTREVHYALKETEAHVEDARKDLPEPRGHPFIIVGVGASAGGYESFAQLLGGLPPKTGMALVFVQHLDPTHESGLSEMLSRATRMPAVEIRHETRCAAG